MTGGGDLRLFIRRRQFYQLSPVARWSGCGLSRRLLSKYSSSFAPPWFSKYRTATDFCVAFAGVAKTPAGGVAAGLRTPSARPEDSRLRFRRRRSVFSSEAV